MQHRNKVIALLVLITLGLAIIQFRQSTTIVNTFQNHLDTLTTYHKVERLIEGVNGNIIELDQYSHFKGNRKGQKTRALLLDESKKGLDSLN
jgi:hypothetical protein